MSGPADRGEYFEVFARHETDEPMRHVGTVRATTVKDAGVFAFSLYDEFKWKAMFVTPRASLVRVIRPE